VTFLTQLRVPPVAVSKAVMIPRWDMRLTD
jgi:hypothetical protein